MAWNPKATDPPLAPMVPFQCPAGLLAETLAPLCVTVAFQEPVICWPLAKVQVSVQPLMVVALVLVIITFAVKPVFHWLT